MLSQAVLYWEMSETCACQWRRLVGWTNDVVSNEQKSSEAGQGKSMEVMMLLRQRIYLLYGLVGCLM